ncbi:MAG: VCBS repeat-containing protein, partial [Deltaproteobacteria bacterium]|nr:VCBS repeat-containing protein [Deltaproteobacteria bacterium]
MEYLRGTLKEWYVNGPQGLEQGFTLEAPPAARAGGPLTIEIEISGDFHVGGDAQANAITLNDQGGGTILSYCGLFAYDADGRDLGAWLEVRGNRVLLRVDDTQARYPVVVDPFLQKAKLTASDGATNDWFGISVAISGDTVVVGAYYDDIGTNADQGSAYVFLKPGGGWTGMTQSAKLTASDGAAADLFGCSVAISGDTVVVGASNDDIGVKDDQGSAYVFVKPGGGWANMTQTAKLTAADGAAADHFGYSVAISGDTVAIGAPYGRVSGWAYVFVKPMGGWSDMTHTAKLTSTDGASADLAGTSVAISDDTVVVGSYRNDVGANTDQGSAYVFVKPGGGWVDMTQTAKLTAADGAAFDLFGYAVAISGNTAVIGAHLDDIGAVSNQGSAYVFMKPSGGWADMTQTAKLTAADGTASDLFGWSVGIGGDLVVVGARDDNAQRGSVYVFAKPVGNWADTTETAKLTAADGAGEDEFGYSVAIAGSTIVIGALYDDFGANIDQGSAYVFEYLAPTPTATPSPTQTPTSSPAATSTPMPQCGNSVVESGEQCDDGNTTAGDGCGAGCAIEAGYVCTGSPSACTTICGDGVVVGWAAAGTLDNTFGAGGIVTTPVGASWDFGNAVKVQSDHKVVVAGSAQSGADDFAVVRYNSDGTLDPTFDGDGKVTTAIGTSHDDANALAIAPDGKLIVAGCVQNANGTQDFAVVRYNANGTLDSSFDGDGKVITALTPDAECAYGVALQGDGKIVVVGKLSIAGNTDIAVVRYNSDGSLDATFAGDGKVTTAIGPAAEQANDVAIQPDGKIVVVGNWDNAGNTDIAILRYNTDGSLDSSFGGDGIVTTSVGTATDTADSVVLQSDGRIVVAGTSRSGSDDDIVVVRYLSDGSLDASFGGDGKVTTDLGSTQDSGYEVVVQDDGKIVVGGTTFTAGRYAFAVARYLSDGSLDTIFGSGGRAVTTVGPGDAGAHGVALQADGAIVVAGNAYNGSNNDFAVVRYVGKGFSGGPEACDDGNTSNGDGCSDACMVQAGYVCAGQPSVCIAFTPTVTGTATSTPSPILTPTLLPTNTPTPLPTFTPSSSPTLSPTWTPTAGGSPGCAAPSFGAATSFAVGSGPFQVATGDFDRDGKPDLAVTNYAANTVSILLGTGTGIFGAATNFAAGSTPHSVAIGDFNTDGKVDLAVTNDTTNTVSILLGTGTGSFGAPTSFPVGTSPWSVAVGDFNRDGVLDLTTANANAGTVSILLGSGAGSFGAATDFSVGSSPQSVAVGDFNGDGTLDVATANLNSTVSILLGNGTGSLGATTNFAVASGARSVATGDFNSDGKLDLVTANLNSNTVSVLLGTGTGTFGAATNFAVGTGTAPVSVVVADFSGDGKLDLATADLGTYTTSVLLGTGTGNFGTAAHFAVGNSPYAVTLGEFNADGRLDLAVVNNGANTVSVLLNSCASTGCTSSFGAATNVAVASVPYSVALGDFSNDGKGDLAVASLDSNTTSILLGNGTGAVGTPMGFTVGSPFSLVKGDFNGDGKLDVVMANFTSNTVSVLLGMGDGGLGAATSFAVGTNPRSVAVGDFNGDGKLDVAVTRVGTGSNTVSILLGTGSGSLGSASSFAVGVTPNSVAVGDFNGDGKLDLVTANAGDGTVSVLLGTGSGSFGVTSFGVGSSPGSVAVGDFDGDGKLDLVTADAHANNVSVFLGTGAGSFGGATNFSVGNGPFFVVTADFDGDSKLDLATANINSNSVSVLLGTGTGSFGAATNFTVGNGPYSIAVGDLNGDGKPDLTAANSAVNSVSV